MTWMINMMKDIERVMISSGWMNVNQEISLTACGEELQQDDSCSRSNSEWKALLQQQKESVITARDSQAQKDKKSKSSLPMYNVNQVKIVDKAFLQKSFKAKSKIDR